MLTRSNESALPNKYRVATPQEIADTSVTKVTTVNSPISGKVQIDGLDLGTYYLKETVAPTGYNQLTDEITVVISTDDSTTPETESNYTRVYYTVGNIQNANENDNKVKVENRPGSMLPQTGGIGTIGLTALGVGVVIFGFIFTSRKKKKAE